MGTANGEMYLLSLLWGRLLEFMKYATMVYPVTEEVTHKAWLVEPTRAHL